MNVRINNLTPYPDELLRRMVQEPVDAYTELNGEPLPEEMEFVLCTDENSLKWQLRNPSARNMSGSSRYFQDPNRADDGCCGYMLVFPHNCRGAIQFFLEKDSGSQKNAVALWDEEHRNARDDTLSSYFSFAEQVVMLLQSSVMRYAATADLG